MVQVTISKKLYGRDREIDELIEAFGRVCRGGGEVLWVPGPSGIGKTVLVRQMEMPVRSRNGLFIEGKFDQYSHNIPYFAFRQALADLCRQMQAMDEKQCRDYQSEILRVMGDMGQLLIDMVPEFESLLGAQPPLGDISPQEARHRFNGVFQAFLKVICTPAHPLVLFIDDWQWADSASLELLKHLQVGLSLRYLLVIAAYRDHEVDLTHPMNLMMVDLQAKAIPVEVMQLGNLRLEHVRMVVAEMLKPVPEDAEALAAILHSQTGGNPFFVRSLLNFLLEFNLVRFDNHRNCWQWQRGEIAAANLPGTVTELFIQKLRRLGMAQQYLFSLAACLGNRFDLETLSILSGYPLQECLAQFTADQARDLFVPLDGGDHPEDDPAAGATHPSWKSPRVWMFLHDRVQQAAYSLMDPVELPAIRLTIGRQLLTHLPPEQLAERLFEVVGDLNAGVQLIQEFSEQVQVFDLNVTAARKAYDAIAFHSALQFYRAANLLMKRTGFSEHLWHDYHELAMRFFMERAECEFIEGSHTEAEDCIQAAVGHARTAIEQADALNILIVQYTLLARYAEAISAGRQALLALGISLPEADFEQVRDVEVAQVRQGLKDRPVAALMDLPVMNDPQMLMASRILIAMGPPCYRSDQRLWSVIVPKVVNLTMRYGNTPQVGYSHTAFGGLLGWVDNDYTTARQFGELATSLMTRTFRSPTAQSVFYLMIGSSVRHWFKHLKYGSQDYTDAYEIGLQSGNLQYAAYAFGHNMVCRFYQGVPLAVLIPESQRSLSFSKIHLNQWAIDLLEGGMMIFGALAGARADESYRQTGDDQRYLDQIENHHNVQITCIYHILKAFSLLILGDYPGALLQSDQAEALLYTVGTQGLLPWPEHVFARLLILSALYPDADGERQSRWRPELDGMLKQLGLWAGNCPDNFEFQYRLAAAELARMDGRSLEALQYYDQAVAGAQSGGFLQWEGLANERAHSFWRERGNEGIAQVYWQQAYACYTLWGAAAKVDCMEMAYRADLADSLPAVDESGQTLNSRVRSAPGIHSEIQEAWLEKQVQQLRRYALQVQHARQGEEAVTQAEEQANAMERLRVEVAERKQVEKALRESEQRFRLLFERHSAVKLVIDPATGRILDANQAAAQYYGWPVETLTRMHIQQINTLPPESVISQLGQATSAEKTYFEFRHRRADGSTRDVEVFSNQIEIAGKAVLYAIIHDITQRKWAEDTLRASLAEKNILLKEIHHRVKNNLQIVASLLSLQARRIQSGEAVSALLDVESRIRSMALLHETLYRSGNFTRINFTLYVQELCAQLLHAYGPASGRVKLELRVAPIDLSLEQSMPCGLILSELVSNALKHAFPGERGGKIMVEMRSEDPQQVVLRVADNGVGLPVDFNPAKATSLGLRLVINLTQQLGGQCALEKSESAGTTIQVVFRLA